MDTVRYLRESYDTGTSGGLCVQLARMESWGTRGIYRETNFNLMWNIISAYLLAITVCWWAEDRRTLGLP